MLTKKRKITIQKEKLIYISVVSCRDNDLSIGCYYVKADKATKLMYNLEKKNPDGEKIITRINLIQALNLWRKKGWKSVEDILYFFTQPWFDQEILFYKDDPKKVKTVIEDWDELAGTLEENNTDFPDFIDICVDIQFSCDRSQAKQKKSYKINRNKEDIIDCYGLTISLESDFPSLSKMKETMNLLNEKD